MTTNQDYSAEVKVIGNQVSVSRKDEAGETQGTVTYTGEWVYPVAEATAPQHDKDRPVMLTESSRSSDLQDAIPGPLGPTLLSVQLASHTRPKKDDTRSRESRLVVKGRSLVLYGVLKPAGDAAPDDRYCDRREDETHDPCPTPKGGRHAER